MKAKTIDRLALTREKFGAKMYGDEPVKGSKSTLLTSSNNYDKRNVAIERVDRRIAND